jgi:hypothetical protein
MKQIFDSIFKDENSLLITNLAKDSKLIKEISINNLLGETIICKKTNGVLLQNREYVIHTVHEMFNPINSSRILHIDVMDKLTGQLIPGTYKPRDFYNYKEYTDKIFNETDF